MRADRGSPRKARLGAFGVVRHGCEVGHVRSVDRVFVFFSLCLSLVSNLGERWRGLLLAEGKASPSGGGSLLPFDLLSNLGATPSGQPLDRNATL
jgi:hypothetical protein